MGKSRVRGGAKNHRKKVNARNERIKSEQNIMQKLFNESMKQQLEELKRKSEIEMSGDTQTAE
jgi:hypothetical protein